MPLLTATFSPGTASVSLVVDGSFWASVPASITVERRVAGRETVPVRGAHRVAAVGGYFVGSDSEMDLDSTVTYVVTGYTSSGSAITGAEVTVSTEGGECGAWLKVAGRPGLNVLTILRNVGDVTSESQGGVYDIAGGRGVAVAEASGTRADRLSLLVGSEDSGHTDRVRAVLDESRIVLVQSCRHRPFDSGWYFIPSVARSMRTQMSEFPGRNFAFDLVRTGVPAGAGQGLASWSWSALLESYATWQDVYEAFPSWFATAQGPGA